MSNLFSLNEDVPLGEEISALLAGQPGGMRVERIVSRSHTTPAGYWYDQEEDEWASVLEGSAEIAYADGGCVILHKGDSLLIPRRVKHRVAWTSDPCIWLTVYGQGLAAFSQ